MNVEGRASLAAAAVRVALMRRGIVLGDDDAEIVRVTLLPHMKDLRDPPPPPPIDHDAPTERIPTGSRPVVPPTPEPDPDRVKRKG